MTQEGEIRRTPWCYLSILLPNSTFPTPGVALPQTLADAKHGRNPATLHSRMK